MTLAQIILVTGAVLAGAVIASLLATRLRIPSLLLFLGIGIVVGSDVTGWVSFGDYELAQDIGIVALALILFDGGLRSGWSEIRPVLGPAVSLAVVGTVVTAAITGLRRGAAARHLDARGTAARRRAVLDRRRGGLRAAARARSCGAGSRARSRASRGSTTRSPCCSSSR